jgi:hypothetical protein
MLTKLFPNPDPVYTMECLGRRYVCRGWVGGGGVSVKGRKIANKKNP